MLYLFLSGFTIERLACCLFTHGLWVGEDLSDVRFEETVVKCLPSWQSKQSLDAPNPVLDHTTPGTVFKTDTAPEQTADRQSMEKLSILHVGTP